MRKYIFGLLLLLLQFELVGQSAHQLLEITQNDISAYPDQLTDSISVFGVRLGITQEEAISRLKTNYNLVYKPVDLGEPGTFTLAVYDKNSKGEQGKFLYYLIWKRGSAVLTHINIFPDFRTYMAGKSRALLTSDFLNPFSDLSLHYLGQGKTTTSMTWKKYYEIRKISTYDKKGMQLTLIASQGDTSVVLQFADFFMDALVPQKKDPNIPVNGDPATAPPPLSKEGEHSVVDTEAVTVEVISPRKLLYHFHKVVEILDKTGAAGELNRTFTFSPSARLIDFKAALYAKNATLVGTKGKDELNESRPYADYPLYDDEFMEELAMSVHSNEYPVKLSYSYDMEYNSFIEFPAWLMQHWAQTVLWGSYTLSLPAGTKFKYTSPNINSIHVDTVALANGYMRYSWKIANLKPIPENGYSTIDLLPCFKAQPNTFEFNGVKGSYSSWNNFGKFLNAVWKGNESLPDSAFALVNSLIAECNTPRERAVKIYNYVHNNYKYVNILFGAGGYAPKTAAATYSAGYGDSKALANLTCALLHRAGIEASPALVLQGKNPEEGDTAYVCNKFNHVILYCPFKDGPVWMDVTNASAPFAVLGSDCEDRIALVFDERGGKLIPTQSLSADENRMEINDTISINQHFFAEVATGIKVTGKYLEDARKRLPNSSVYQHANSIYYLLYFRHLAKHAYDKLEETTDNLSFTVNAEYPQAYDSTEGKQYYFRGALMDMWTPFIKPDSLIQSKLVLDFPFCKKETAIFIFNHEDSVTIPPDEHLESPHLSFIRSYQKLPGNSVRILTLFELKSNLIPKAEVKTFRESIQQVNQYLNQRVLVQVK